MGTTIVTLGGFSAQGELLEDIAPHTLATLGGLVPFQATMHQEEFSGYLLSASLDGVLDPPKVGRDHLLWDIGDRVDPFQEPGVIYYAPSVNRLVLPYGQSRYQDQFGPLPVIPIIRIHGDLGALHDEGYAVQFDGPISFGLDTGPDELTKPDGHDDVEMILTLGDAEAGVALVGGELAELAESMLSALPAKGRATNTHSGGPLVRFWNDLGGKKGETPLDGLPDEPPEQAILYTGHIYYVRLPGPRGLRIVTRRPSVMRSAVTGGVARQVPLGRIVYGLTDLAAQSELLLTKSSLPMTLRRP